MFYVDDHVVHVEGEPLARDLSAEQAQALSAGPLRAPVNGTVYGTLLNDPATLVAMGDSLNEAPYKAPPKAPVLYVKPRNTLAGHRSVLKLDASVEGMEVGASLGIVIGRVANQVHEKDALDYIAGFTTVVDLCVPHASVYRPSLRFRVRDGSCIIGPAIAARQPGDQGAAVAVRVSINGDEKFVGSTENVVRGVAKLLADATEFMTLSPGDVITLGALRGAPLARAGDQVSVSIGNLLPLEFSVAGEQA